MPDVVALAENVENSFCTALLPHFSQRGVLERVLLCRASIVCPHCLHLYSKIGITNLPLFCSGTLTQALALPGKRPKPVTIHMRLDRLFYAFGACVTLFSKTHATQP